MKVAAVIPSLYKVDSEYLKLCVKSLRATTDWDIIVVTNGTPAPEPIDLPGVTKRLHTRDQGQCIATNIGVSQVGDADYILVSNSDMYYAPNWNKNLRFDYPCFSPNLIEPTDNAGSAPPFKKLDAGLTIEAFKPGEVRAYVQNRNALAEGLEDAYESGFNLPFFIRKDLWDLLGGYDTAYDPWGSNSDTDLQTRLNLAGVTPMRLRDVLVYHFSNKSGTFDGTHQDFYRNNIEYFHDKFGFDRDELGSDVWYNKDMLPQDKERIRYAQKPYIS